MPAEAINELLWMGNKRGCGYHDPKYTVRFDCIRPHTQGYFNLNRKPLPSHICQLNRRVQVHSDCRDVARNVSAM